MGQASSVPRFGGSLLNCLHFSRKSKRPRATTPNINNNINHNRNRRHNRHQNHNPPGPEQPEDANMDFQNIINLIVLDDDDEDDGHEVIPIEDGPVDDSNRETVPAEDTDDSIEQPNPLDTARDNCKDGIKAVFPEICPIYVENLAAGLGYNLDAAIGVILDRLENGQKYPIQENPLKRKFGDISEDEDEDADASQKITRAMQAKMAEPGYAGKQLSKDFPKVPIQTIRSYLYRNNLSIFDAYTAMDDANRSWDPLSPAWKEKRSSSRQTTNFEEDQRPEARAAWAELQAARELRAAKDGKVAEAAAEERNIANAKANGETAECGCCYDEIPLNRMIQCSGDPVHWFCRDCMRSHAETEIGQSRHELTCMSVDGCQAGFSRSQRDLFLDKKLRTALERLEQESSLQKAGIDNLETCPFCPYAAECPPIEEDKEFRCIRAGCMKISCRLCRKETHIPKTCAEAAADRGVDARHILEEAMSVALIRKCNKCDRPYLKADGCNKIRCTHCGTLQCYVCRKTITSYDHFSDPHRGGREGQCPLFDRTEERHEQEVKRAEEEARQKVAQTNPEFDADALKFNVSDRVKKDDQRRKKEGYNEGQRDPADYPPHAYIGRPHPRPHLPPPPNPYDRRYAPPAPEPAPRHRGHHRRLTAEQRARLGYQDGHPPAQFNHYPGVAPPFPPMLPMEFFPPGDDILPPRDEVLDHLRDLRHQYDRGDYNGRH
ncbi:hypothetical protein F5Y04DRAFT_282273 [Hypomontagnella monticulosa]|nr:hypothetical protein F5Y04DRAFT_282273 [Hypomontagnella monticulosa]